MTEVQTNKAIHLMVAFFPFGRNLFDQAAMAVDGIGLGIQFQTMGLTYTV